MGKKIPILSYHKVDEAAPTRHWMTTSEFDAQMSALHSYGFRAVTLEDIRQHVRGEKGLPEEPICLTFDDGYRNFYTSAYPILKKYAFVATVFLPTDYIGTEVRRMNDWDRSPEELAFPTPHMVWPEVEELHRGGILIGAHTQTHPDLAEMLKSEPSRVASEIIASKREIESRLDVPVHFMAYPYKSSNEALEELVHEAGFHGAVIDNGNIFDTATDNWFRMNRIAILSR
ncbi:MAG: polysaccharide deacetylase family protein [Dehalococcoidia bacterium]|nr:polysaccharide deacetylase family protein [Dehalococcoidia bacterium]